MRRATALLSCTAILIVAGLAGAEDQRINLFSGNLNAVEIGSWGSGSVEVDDSEKYLDHDVLAVSTSGFFTGGRLDLRQPIPAGQFLADPEGGYVRLVVKPREPQPVTLDMPGEMFPPGFGDFPMGPGEDPGFRPPPGDGWIDDAPYHPEDDLGMHDQMGMVAPPAPPEKIEQLRVLLVTDRGAVDSGAIVLEEYSELVDDWKQVVIPLSAFRGIVDVSQGEIQQIALFGDTEEQFFVGEVTLGYEEQPLIADAGEQRTVRANEPVTFEAAPQPAGVNATYVWDFDHLDGIQEEGYGTEATWTFVTPGFYVVTLTVSDPAGRKVDRTDRVLVRVE